MDQERPYLPPDANSGLLHEQHVGDDDCEAFAQEREDLKFCNSRLLAMTSAVIGSQPSHVSESQQALAAGLPRAAESLETSFVSEHTTLHPTTSLPAALSPDPRVSSYNPQVQRACSNRLTLEFRDFSFEGVLHSCFGLFRAGEVTALIGPSGAGKSSLLNLISGRQRAAKMTSGEIKYGGQVITIAEIKAATGYVMQEDHLSPVQTVRETLTFAGILTLSLENHEEEEMESVEGVQVVGVDDTAGNSSNNSPNTGSNKSPPHSSNTGRHEVYGEEKQPLLSTPSMNVTHADGSVADTYDPATANNPSGGRPTSRSKAPSGNPTNKSKGDRLSQIVARAVDECLEQLQLVKCADTYVGDIQLKGISGGEKRRVSVGIELLPNPPLLFLDEPTSGLDSVTSLKLLILLREIAVSRNCIIVCTIHQPAADVWSQFSRVICLRKGVVLFHGWVNNALEPNLAKPGSTGGSNNAVKADKESDLDKNFNSAIRYLEGVENFLEHILGCPLPQEGWTLPDWLLYLAQTFSQEEAAYTAAQTRRIFELAHPSLSVNAARNKELLANDSSTVPNPFLARSFTDNVQNKRMVDEFLNRQLMMHDRMSGTFALCQENGVRSSADNDGETSLLRTHSDLRRIRSSTIMSATQSAITNPDGTISGHSFAHTNPHGLNLALAGIREEGVDVQGSAVSSSDTTFVRNSPTTTANTMANAGSAANFTSVTTSGGHISDLALAGQSMVPGSSSATSRPCGTNTNSGPDVSGGFPPSSVSFACPPLNNTSAVLSKRKAFPHCCRQYNALLIREVKNVFRKKMSLLLFLLSAFLNVSLGGGYYWRFAENIKNGVKFDGSELVTQPDFDSAVNNFVGSAQNTLTTVMFYAAAAQYTALPAERKIFLREYSSRMYSIPAYILSKFTVETVLTFLFDMIAFLLLYGMYGFDVLDGQDGGNKFLIYFVLPFCNFYVLGFCGGSMGLFLSSITADNKAGALVWAPLFLTTIPNSFANPFRPVEDLPRAISWMQYLVPPAYAYRVQNCVLTRGIVLAEPDYAKLAPNDSAQQQVMQEAFTKKSAMMTQIKSDLKEKVCLYFSTDWNTEVCINIILVIALFFLYRISAAAILYCTSRNLFK